jgi:PAS domain S-box-containing protein
MKRAFSCVLVTLLSVSMLMSTKAATALQTDGPPNVHFRMSPGSIIQFEHLTIQEGLSQNAGLVIMQDQQGYLWIGTQDGLNRYDGHGFTVFKHDPQNASSISHNSILSLTEDQQGQLWIGTWGGGLNRYDPITQTFVRYLANPNDPSTLSSDIVTSIREDSAGTLWVGTLGGLHRFDPSTDSFIRYQHDPNDPESLSSNAISVIFEDTLGQLWIGTGAIGIEGAGLNRFDPSTGKAVRYQHSEADPRSLSSNNIAAIYEAPDGTFWIATGGFSLHGGGLNQFDPRTGLVRRFQHNPKVSDSLSTDDLMTLWGDANGVLWIGTRTNGLSVMNLAEPGRFMHYRHDPFIPNSLGGNEIRSLYKDHCGNLWIGTSHSGINKLSANAGMFSLYRTNPSIPSSLGTNAVGGFAEDRNGNIWVATWGAGLERFDPETGRFVHFRHDPDNPNSLSDDMLMSLYVDGEDRVWAGTQGKGLNQLSATTGRVTRYMHDPAKPDSLPDDNIAAIISDGNGGLWIGTFGGLAHYESRADTFINYIHDPLNPSSLSENKVVSLYLDQARKILWIGTWGGGLNRLDIGDSLHADPELAVFTSYRHDPDDPASLSENSIWSIHKTADGALWLGTQMGLNRLDPNTQTFQHYTEKDGLPNNVVRGILEDDQANLWLTTSNGLAQFNLHTGEFTAYDAWDGLQSNEFNPNAYFRATDGTMYVGGIDGFNRFDPEAIEPNRTPPRVAVTSIEVFNEPMAVDLSGRELIELSHQQDVISFEFAAFDFLAPQKNQYAYMLEGFDKEWIQAGNRRFATYINLPGGQYVFRVKASNSDGVWNETGAAVPLLILPPIWQTWWFIGLLIVTGSVLLASAFRWRLNTIREQNIYLETQIAERTAELREMNQLLEREVEQRKRAETELARRAAEQLHQSEERFRVMFENAGIGIALVGMDRRPLEANARFIEMTGYSAEEFFTKSGAELSYPEDADIGIPELQEVLAGNLNSYQIEKRYIRKNGQIYWVRLTNSVVRDAEGNPQYFVTMVEDIHDQKQAAEELRKSQARFQAIFDNVAVGVAVMSLDRRPIAINATTERIVGYSLEELQSMDARSLAVPEDRNMDTTLFPELIAGKRDSYVIERRYRRKGGRIFWARVNYSLVRDLQGKPDYLIGIIEDIDEQKRAQERLAAQEADYLLMLQQRVAERTRKLEEANQRLQREIEERVRIEKELAERAADEAVMADRTRLARDLHDAVTQTLFSARWMWRKPNVPRRNFGS